MVTRWPIVYIAVPTFVVILVLIFLILCPPLPSSSQIIDQYASQLREKYHEALIRYKDPKYNKFPNAGSSVYVNVPFINLVSILIRNNTKRNNTWLLTTNVKDMKQNEEIMKIQFEDILKPVSNKRLRFVLMEGEPGIGKSTLAKELALRWAEKSDKTLSKYYIAILIQLRFEIYHKAQGIDDLFIEFEDQMTELKLEVNKSKGEGVLWILDGFDELPYHLRNNNSIFMQLISGYILPKSTVIVTSRPVASDPLLTFLHNHNSKRISLRGFDSDKSMEYASKYFNNKAIFADFQAYYSSNLVIESMLYNPLNCYIVCTIFNDFIATNSTQYPRTMTALYNHYVRVLLKRHLLDVGIISDIDYNMPKQLIREIDFSNSVLVNVWKDFSLLSKIAYDGVMKQEYIFGKELNNITKLSMMDTVVNFFAFDKDESSSFVHTTLQEYLAAVHIVNDKLNFTVTHKLPLNFKIVLTFYVGIIKILGRKVDTTVLDILKRNMTIQEWDNNKDVDIGSLLIGCLYEDDSLIYKIHLPLDHRFHLESSFPTNFEIYISGYLTAVHNITFRVHFYNSDNLKAFHKGLQSHSNISGELIVLLFVEDAYERQRALEELLTMPSHVVKGFAIPPFYNLDMPAICKIITKFQLLQEITFYSDNFYCDPGPENPLLKLNKLNKLTTAVNFPNKNVFETLKQLTAPGKPLRKFEIEGLGSPYSNILNLIKKDSSLEELKIGDSFDVFRHGTEIYIPSPDGVVTVLQEIIWTKNTNNLRVDHYQKFIYNLELGKIQSTTQLSSFTSFMHVKIKKKWHYANITVYSESGTSELTYFITAFNNCSLSLRRSTENVAKIKLKGKFTCSISSKEMPEEMRERMFKIMYREIPEEMHEEMHKEMHEEIPEEMHEEIHQNMPRLAYYQGGSCLNKELNSMKEFIYNFLAVLPIPLLIILRQIYTFKCLVDIMFVVNCIFLVFRFIVSILYQSVLSVFGYNLVVILAVSISFYLIIVFRQ